MTGATGSLALKGHLLGLLAVSFGLGFQPPLTGIQLPVIDPIATTEVRQPAVLQTSAVITSVQSPVQEVSTQITGSQPPALDPVAEVEE